MDKKAEPREGEVRAGYYGIGARSSRPLFIITIATAANVIMMHPLSADDITYSHKYIIYKPNKTIISRHDSKYKLVNYCRLFYNVFCQDIMILLF